MTLHENKKKGGSKGLNAPVRTPIYCGHRLVYHKPVSTFTE